MDVIPVYQTVHGPGGNCFEACLASILEVPLESVPVFGGWREVDRWVVDRGWLLPQRHQAAGFRLSVYAEHGEPKGLAIVSLQTLTGIHAVVCLDGQIVHDPSPRPFGRPENPVLLWTQLRKL